MTIFLTLIALAFALGALSFMAWAWLAYNRVQDELSALGHFEGMHFDPAMPGEG